MRKLLNVLIVLLIATSAPAQPKGVNYEEFKHIDQVTEYEVDHIDELRIKRESGSYFILWDLSPVAVKESLTKLVEILDANDALGQHDDDDSLISPLVDDVYTNYTMIAATCKIKESQILRYWYVKGWTVAWSIDHNYAGVVIFKESIKGISL